LLLYNYIFILPHFGWSVALSSLDGFYGRVDKHVVLAHEFIYHTALSLIDAADGAPLALRPMASPFLFKGCDKIHLKTQQPSWCNCPNQAG